MQIRCASCGHGVAVADTGVLPAACPHCHDRPVPERLGRFRIVRLLAAGGMGEVYLGEHEDLGTRAAIKLLPVGPGADATTVRERFRREARLTAAIGHRGVVQVLDLAEDRGRLFLVLELVDGRSLRSRLKDGPLPVPEALRIAAAAADVLGAAHRHGVVHRDVKPENVMLDGDGRVRVLDFGIARALQDQQPLTRTGELLGTPEYMAPEQLLDTAESVDARTDVHALGVLTWELLTGRSPFAGQNLFSALKLVESLAPPPPSRLAAGVPAAVDAVVLQALAKDPQQRPADGGAYAAMLRAAWGASLDAAPATRRPRPAPWLLVAAAFVLGALVVQPWSRRSGTPADGRDEARAAAGTGDEIAELDALLAGPVLHASEGARLRALLAALPRGEDPVALRRSGAAKLRLGEFLGALTDLEDAHRLGDAAAGPRAAVAWHAVHTLLPAMAGAPCWLSLVDRSRRDRLLGLAAGHDGDEAAGHDAATAPPLLQGGRLLAQADAAAAWQSLAAVPFEEWTEEHALLALIAARLCCADRGQFARAAARIESRFGSPAVRLAAATTPLDAEERLGAHVRQLAATGSDRWLAELFLGWLQAQHGGCRPERVRAAAELAWYTGADALAPVWCAALQLALAVPVPAAAVDRAQALRLQELVRGLPPAEHPALAWVLAWTERIAEGPDAAQRLLAALPVSEADPGCAPLRTWTQAGGWIAAVHAEALAPLAGGGRAGPPALTEQGPGAATACALWAWTAAPAGDEARAQCRGAWDRALAGGADFAGVPAWRAPHPDSLRALVAALAASAAGAGKPATKSFLAALRLCIGAGGDVGPLRSTFDREITGGVQ